MKKLMLIVACIVMTIATQAQTQAQLVNRHFTSQIGDLVIVVVAVVLIVCFGLIMICIKSRLIKKGPINLEDDPKEIKITEEESWKIEKGKCIKCPGDVKGGLDEKKEYLILTCSECGSLYHQYFPYGSFFLQTEISISLQK